ncbi:MAG: hypothetical protein HOP17_04210 [Acidobacteria bacterium]|nr:hypothetical protein [Acidobacteriota bacterium]
MSWASIYWDLDHIVQAAREAMESAFAAESATSPRAISPSDPIPSVALAENPITSDLNAQFAGIPVNANADALKSVEALLNSGTSSTAPAVEQFKTSPDGLEPSLNESLLKARALNTLNNQADIPPRSPWTAEIEAALREFLRPLSVDLRYEYRLPDALDENRSMAALNSLFKQGVKPDEVSSREVLARNELRRKSRTPGDLRSRTRQEPRPPSKTVE